MNGVCRRFLRIAQVRANKIVWSAALSQAKNERDRMVCANVFGLRWSTKLRFRYVSRLSQSELQSQAGCTRPRSRSTGIFNVFKEFWPDINRTVFRGHY